MMRLPDADGIWREVPCTRRRWPHLPELWDGDLGGPAWLSFEDEEEFARRISDSASHGVCPECSR